MAKKPNVISTMGKIHALETLESVINLLPLGCTITKADFIKAMDSYRKTLFEEFEEANKAFEKDKAKSDAYFDKQIAKIKKIRCNTHKIMQKTAQE